MILTLILTFFWTERFSRSKNTNTCYIWFNTLGDGFVDIEITFFEKKGEVYVRTEETQRQYIHEIEDVYSALKDAGFSLKNVCDDLGGELKSDSMRAVFTAIKN